VTREVTLSCSRCQQPVHTVEHRTAQARKTYAATATKVAARSVM
jgi:hypothetical protein